MDSDFVIVGGGLSGLIAAKELDFPVIERSELGGFFLKDEYPVNGIKGKDLVQGFLSKVKVIEGTAFRVNEDGVDVLTEEGILRLRGTAIGATGFRERTMAELGIFGFRPSGIFPLYAAWELVNRGYEMGEKVVIYGFNHYSLSLASKLKGREVTFVYRRGSLVHEEDEILDMGFQALKGRIIWVQGKKRLSMIRTEGGKLEADTLIIAELSPWNPLSFRHLVGNSAMIVEDPSKIVAGTLLVVKSLASNGRKVRVRCSVPCIPKEVPASSPEIMLDVGAGTKVRINGRELVAEEPYPIVEVPPENAKVEVVGCMES